jgi:acyl-CoA thioester hydrolase
LAEAAADEGRLGSNLPPWSYRIQYLGEVTYPGDYDIGLRVGSFDNDHLDYELGLFRGTTCLGVADAIGGRGELPAVRSSGSANWRGKAQPS